MNTTGINRWVVLITVAGLIYPAKLSAQVEGSQAAQSVQREFAQEEPQQEVSTNAYQQALQEHRAMLTGQQPIQFKRAVFITENAYFGNQLSYEKFNQVIRRLTALCLSFKEANSLSYYEKDKEEVNSWSAIFKVMTDTLPIVGKDGKIVSYYPYRYDFEDFWGERQWVQMFVTKLLTVGTGNCHSLPFLYKIVAEEMHTTAHLALAPNHIYIKHRAKKGGWYNTELTSASFPMDAWLMASGYINTEAVVNGIYMDTLSLQQSVAVCVTDLANGYEKRFGTGDGRFMLECCDLALQYYPNYINAMLLKVETQKKQFEHLMKVNHAKHAKEIFHLQPAKELFTRMEKSYLAIHQLGYRRMPKEMYEKWLVELQTEKAKYTNSNVPAHAKEK